MLHEDIEKVVFSEEQIQNRIAEMAKEITEDYKDVKEDIFCVAIMKGAVMFYTDLLRKLELPVHLDFMIASSYGNGTSTTGSVKILKDLDYDIEGKHLIVIEDIIDSGTTMNYLNKYFKERKPKSIKLCSLLSKPSRRRVDVPFAAIVPLVWWKCPLTIVVLKCRMNSWSVMVLTMRKFTAICRISVC